MPFRYVKDAQGEPIMPKVSSGLLFALEFALTGSSGDGGSD